MDRDRVKPFSAFESAPSGGLSFGVWDGLIAELWIESGERFAGPAAGATGRDAAPTLAGMVLSSPRQSREETPYAGSGNLFAPSLRWALAWWPEEQQELALAFDATTLGQRFTVLCVGVLVRGCAIPVAWKVLAYNQRDPGSPIGKVTGAPRWRDPHRVERARVG